MGMTRLLTFAFLFCCFCVRAANPAFTAFIGTNQVVIASNTTTGKIIIGPATPISTTASNAAFSTAVWTNKSGAITIQGSNQPVFSPGITSADGVAAYEFGTSNLITHDTAHLARFMNQGTNKLAIGRDGRISVGPNTENDFGFNFGTIVQCYYHTALGEPRQQNIYFTVLDNGNNEHKLTIQNHTNDSYILFEPFGQPRTMINPTADDGSSAIPYFFDTSKIMSTVGSHLMDVRNKGTNKFTIDKDGNANSKGVYSFTGGSLSNAFSTGRYFTDGSLYTNLNGTPTTFTNTAQLTIPAHMLTNNQDTVRMYWSGIGADAMQNTQQLRIVYGSINALDTGLQAGSNYWYRAWMKVARTGNTSQRVEAELEWGPRLLGATGLAWSKTNVNFVASQTNGISTVCTLSIAAQRVGALTNTGVDAWFDPAPR